MKLPQSNTILNVKIMITISIGTPRRRLDMYQYCQKQPSATPLVIEYNIVRSALLLPASLGPKKKKLRWVGRRETPGWYNLLQFGESVANLLICYLYRLIYFTASEQGAASRAVEDAKRDE